MRAFKPLAGIFASSLTLGLFNEGSDVAAIEVYPDGSGNDPRMQVEIDGAFDVGVVDDDGTELSVYGAHRRLVNTSAT
jgi:hypothetical protein